MTFWLLAAGIALLPVVFGGAVSARLASAAWARRCPRAALVLWQTIGLAGGLGAIGIGLVAAVAPLPAFFPHGMHTLAGQVVAGQGLTGLGAAHIAALAWSVGLVAWLLAHTVRAGVQAVEEKRRQRLLVDVVADRSSAHDFYVLPSAARLAYCVPGRSARIVLSRGAVDSLAPRELDAVLGHERAHARGRHDLVLLPFTALATAFPWLPLARTARQAVPLLLEMIADDHARRAHGDLPLARALVRMAQPPGETPGVLAAADTGVVQRVERLLAEPAAGSGWVPTAAYSTAGLLLAGPLTVLVAPLLCSTIWRI